MPSGVNWGLPALTVLVGAVLSYWALPQVQAAAGGLEPFDLRWSGYDLTAARAFLTALTAAGRALYLGPVRLIDSAFPILLTLTLCLPLRGRPPVWFLPALTCGLLDLAENVTVARLLQIGPEVGAGPVALASALTMAKFAAFMVALAMALTGLWRRWRAR